MAGQKVVVSERAMAARINRELKKQGESLRRCREDSRWFHDLGQYYTLDLERNVISDKQVDLTELAKKLGVLRPYEVLAPVGR